MYLSCNWKKKLLWKLWFFSNITQSLLIKNQILSHCFRFWVYEALTIMSASFLLTRSIHFTQNSVLPSLVRLLKSCWCFSSLLYVPSKCCYLPTNPHGTTSQRLTINIFFAVRTSNFRILFALQSYHDMLSVTL